EQSRRRRNSCVRGGHDSPSFQTADQMASDRLGPASGALALQLLCHPRYPCNPRIKKISHAETGFGSADLREPRAARTKLLPSSHIGPGNLRHSVKTSSSALTNMSTSFSPMMSGGRIFITSIA